MAGKKDLTLDLHNLKIVTLDLQMAIQDHQTAHFQKFLMINKMFLTELQMDTPNQTPNILIIIIDREFTVVKVFLKMASLPIFPILPITTKTINQMQDQMVTQRI